MPLFMFHWWFIIVVNYRQHRLTDNLVHSAMVLAGGIGSVVGWKAKALRWNQELWREKTIGISIAFPLAPCLCCCSLGAIDHPTTEMFVWVGDGASPYHINATGREATSPAAIGCWHHPRACACMEMQEHIVHQLHYQGSQDFRRPDLVWSCEYR
jgi:hypothetical protein